MAKHMTTAEVVELRERHAWLRELREDPETGKSQADKDIDHQVAVEFKVSASHVRDIVMGVVHAEAGGPIDAARARRRELYRAEREALGDTEARRRMNLRVRGIDPEPKAIRWSQRAVIVGANGRDTDMAYVLEPGQSIRVELVAEGGRR
ncbi:hypothetical protein FDJ13_gp62 [Gordonia phage Gustav]|uniref:Uncharacterized protein n=1 Tax=Gordonia phage Gustav TaxID=2047872 RepID=A0A2H4PA55_9CAUD|nr:hypothetical protein FDJ13_gp62 [Gordonia phage Gustav]ATW59122.1 hypothetical protein PHIRE_GUSTAV_62 [Gordonia phage Gustav]